MSMKLILSFALVCLAVTFVTVECSPEPQNEAAESAKETESKPKGLLSYGSHLASSLNRDFKEAAESAKDYGFRLASSSISTLKGAAESAQETINKVDPVSKTLNAASTAITTMGEVHNYMKGAAESAKEAIKKVNPLTGTLHEASKAMGEIHKDMKGAAESAVSGTSNAASKAMGEVHNDMMPKQMAEFFSAKP